MARRKNIQLCSPYRPAVLERILARSGKVLVQPKLKGVHVLWDGARLVSGNGFDLPALTHISRTMARRHPGRPMEGEAYVHGMSEGRIAGLCRRAAPNADTARIELHVFDLAQPRMPARDRLASVAGLTAGHSVRPVPYYEAAGRGRVVDLLREQVAAGFEGIVIRDPESFWRPGKHMGCMKWKPDGKDVYTVIEVRQGRGPAAGMASALIMADREGNRFTVGGIAFSHRRRRVLWELRGQATGRLGLVTYTGAGGGKGLEGAVFRRFWEPWPELSDGRPRMSFRIDLGSAS